jgi:N-terminal half of MaoC dehydratase
MADVDIRAVRDEWVGRVFQEIDLVVDRERMLEWAIACGETDPRFIDPDHPDFQASTAFPTHVNAARMLPDNFPQFGSGRGIDGGKSIEWHRPMRPGDHLHATVQISDVYDKTGRSGTRTFIVNRMTFTDAQGRLVATVDWRMIRQD